MRSTTRTAAMLPVTPTTILFPDSVSLTEPEMSEGIIVMQIHAVTKRWLFPFQACRHGLCAQIPGKHKPYLTIQSRDYAVPGWPSWLGRETHRVKA